MTHPDEPLPVAARPQRRIGLRPALAWSLAGHAVVMVLAAVLIRHASTTPTLTHFVDLEGLIAKRAEDASTERHALASAQRPAVTEPPRRTGEPPTRVTPSVDPATERGLGARAATTEPSATAAPEGSNASTDPPRPATRVDDPAEDASRLKQYLTSVRRRLQAALVYPASARALGLEGTTTLVMAINVDGNLRPGSLRLLISSGDDEMDRAALQAARQAAPFDRPPRELDATIGVSFSQRP